MLESWIILGSFQIIFRIFSNYFQIILYHLRSFLGLFGINFELFWSILGLFWDYFGIILELFLICDHFLRNFKEKDTDAKKEVSKIQKVLLTFSKIIYD